MCAGLELPSGTDHLRSSASSSTCHSCFACATDTVVITGQPVADPLALHMHASESGTASSLVQRTTAGSAKSRIGTRRDFRIRGKRRCSALDVTTLPSIVSEYHRRLSSSFGSRRLRPLSSPAYPQVIVYVNGAGLPRSRATTATRRGSRSPRSPAAWTGGGDSQGIPYDPTGEKARAVKARYRSVPRVRRSNSRATARVTPTRTARPATRRDRADLDARAGARRDARMARATRKAADI